MNHIFLVVGNSGAGKDTLIREVQKRFPTNKIAVKVPIRVITRPPSPGTEDFESVDEKTFLKLKNEGAFALDWHIYDMYYGVRKEIIEWSNQGHPVLINVSRNIIEPARKRYPGIKVIFVRVPFEITEKRLQKRGRERGEALNIRLERARKNQDPASADYVVDNSGDLAEASKTMLEYILKTNSI